MRQNQEVNVKMKQRALLILLFLVSCGKGVKSPDGIEQADPYFWKAEKEGKISYWLGTVHVGVALHELPCSALIQKQLQESDLVWTEIGLKSNLSEKEDRLSPQSEDFKSLDSETQSFLKAKGFEDNLNYLSYIAHLELLCFQEGLGVSALMISMDVQVTQVAQFSKIPVKALDDPGVLKDLKTAFTKESVEQKVKNYPQCPEQIKNFVHQYKTSRLDDPVDSKLIKNRNEKWLEKFTTSYKNYDQIFVAAGQAHFIGPFNILDMLTEEGFAVQRVSCSQ